MLDLSPTKLLIIFIVVVVLLGPKRLPEVARQLGAGWRRLRELQLQLDRDIRRSLPDLPSSQDIVRFARSPMTLLDELADRHEETAPCDQEPDGAPGVGLAAGGAAEPSAGEPPGRPADASAWASFGLVGADDPNLN